eukprot:4052692-Prymnesium_polylepis.1
MCIRDSACAARLDRVVQHRLPCGGTPPAARRVRTPCPHGVHRARVVRGAFLLRGTRVIIRGGAGRLRCGFREVMVPRPHAPSTHSARGALWARAGRDGLLAVRPRLASALRAALRVCRLLRPHQEGDVRAGAAAGLSLIHI